MGRRLVIVVGDRTSHGGVVLTGADRVRIQGHPIARRGDTGHCPQCKCQFTIAEGHPHQKIRGKTIALEGMMTSCGAHLIGGMQAIVRSTLYSNNTSLSNSTGPFDDHYRINDIQTGNPLPNTEYAIARLNGKIEYGTTDNQGKTHLLAAIAEQEQITVYLEG